MFLTRKYVFDKIINRMKWMWNISEFMYISIYNGYSLTISLIETESQNNLWYVNSKKKMAVIASNGPSHHPTSLRLGLAAHQPSRRHHTQSLLGPSCNDPRTPLVLESHHERAAPLSRRDDEWRHAVGSHSVLALRLYLAACNPSWRCCFWVLERLCFNLSQLFHACWITETRSLNLCVCSCLFLSCLCFSARNGLQLWVPVCNLFIITKAIPLLLLPQYSFLSVSQILNHSDTCAVPSVRHTVGLLILLKLCPVFTFLQLLMTKGLWVIYTYTCSPRFSIDVVVSASDDPCICWH